MVSGPVHTTYAHFALGFPWPPRENRLGKGRIYRLVGSCCKKHAVTHSPSNPGEELLLFVGGTVSGSISLPSTGFFSPSAYATCSLSISQNIEPWQLVLPDSLGLFVFRGTLEHRRGRQVNVTYKTITFWGSAFQRIRLLICLVTSSPAKPERLCPHHSCAMHNCFRLLPFRSPLLRESLLLLFPPGTEMFHFSGYASPTFK